MAAVACDPQRGFWSSRNLSSHILETGSPTSEVGRAPLPPKTLGEGLPASAGGRDPGCPWAGAACFGHLWHFPLLVRTPVTEDGVTLVTSC